MNDALDKCTYCGETNCEIQMDHIVPVTRGGDSIDENLTPACEPCNRAKRNRLPSEWLKEVPPEIAEMERRAIEANGGVLPPRERPPVGPKKLITIKMSAAENDRVMAAANACRRNLSAWSRIALLEAADRAAKGERI